jgi:hypothetical protein
MPPLTVENSGELVGGGIFEIGKDKTMQQKAAVPAEVQFDVVTAFYFKGEIMEVGKRVTLPRSFAIEMQSANRGKIATPVAAETAPAPVAASAPAKGKEVGKDGK